MTAQTNSRKKTMGSGLAFSLAWNKGKKQDLTPLLFDIFAGSMDGIRNPKAHDSIQITAERALHHLMLASLLFDRLGDRK